MNKDMEKFKYELSKSVEQEMINRTSERWAKEQKKIAMHKRSCIEQAKIGEQTEEQDFLDVITGVIQTVSLYNNITKESVQNFEGIDINYFDKEKFTKSWQEWMRAKREEIELQQD